MTDPREEVGILRDLAVRIRQCDDPYELERLYQQAVNTWVRFTQSVINLQAGDLLEQHTSTMRYVAQSEGGRMIRSHQNAQKSKATHADKDRASERFVQARDGMVRQIQFAIHRMQEPSA